MTNKPTCSPHGWTLDTLERYLSSRIDSLEKKLDEREQHTVERFEIASSIVKAAQASSDKAIDKAEFAAEKRFDSVNEFRGMLSDQATNFLTRNVYEVQHKALAERLETFAERFTKMEAVIAARKEGIGVTGFLILGGFSVLASVVSVITLIIHIYKP